MNGILNLLKPPGMSSNQAVGRVRRLAGEKKAGHTGTLDPAACGVLPICLGKATRLFDQLVEKEKTYIAELTLGAATDTGDVQGRIIARADCAIERTQLEAALPAFRGDIWQVPPMVSALKHNGQRLYQLARQGVEVERPARPVTIHELTVPAQISPNRYLLRVRCSRGTYIRVLCEDIGAALGVPAHMGFLLRSASGPFNLDNAVTLEQAQRAALRGDFESLLLPMDMPLRHLPAVRVGPQGVRFAQNGTQVPLKWLEGPLPEDGVIARMQVGEAFWGLCAVDRPADVLCIKSLLIDREG